MMLFVLTRVGKPLAPGHLAIAAPVARTYRLYLLVTFGVVDNQMPLETGRSCRAIRDTTEPFPTCQLQHRARA